MLKNRHSPKSHRQGQMVKLLDAVQKLIRLSFSDNIVIQNDEEETDIDSFGYNPEVVDEMREICRELRSFDITEYGNLYLTSGGRVVLDKGYGEYFNGGDTVICTLDELSSGFNLDSFKQRLDEAVEKRNKKK